MFRVEQIFLILFATCAFTKEICDDCVIVSPYIEAGDIELVKNLTRVDSRNFLGVDSYSGFITVNKEFSSNLFYWFFPYDESALQGTPWIIWLNGGPGASSLRGLFGSIGPFLVENGTLKLRDVTWLENYSLLFIDSPVGAGFSFTADERGYPAAVDAVAAQLYECLRQFVSIFPSLAGAPLFVAGSSYAGKYVPALAYRLHCNRTLSLQLKGIVLGNALIDPENMMHYSELCDALGLLDGEELQHLTHLEQDVGVLIAQNKYYDASNKMNETVEYIKNVSGISVYNFEKDPDNEAPQHEHFLNRLDVRKWIHVGNATFDNNNQLVYKKMLSDISNSSKPYIEVLLDHYGVLTYSGQLDIIVGYSLSKQAYNSLQWSRRDEYQRAKRRRLRKNNSTVVGYKKAGGNLVDVLIRGAGHDAPADRPDVTKFLLDNFVQQYV